MHRLFVALRPPSAIRTMLLDLGRNLPGLRWQDDGQLHLTLRFVGEVSSHVADDLAAALQSISFAPFEVAIRGVGRYDQRRGGALWAGVASKEPLVALATKINRACKLVGIEPDHRAYHPHVTLARWSGPVPALDSFFERNAGFSLAPWRVDRFNLYESQLTRHGAHYDIIFDVPGNGLRDPRHTGLLFNPPEQA